MRTIKREIRKSFAAAMDAAISAQYGEFNWEEKIVGKLAEQFDNAATKNALWIDTVRELVHDNLRRRGKVQFSSQLKLWTDDDLKLGVIMLGDGLAVSYDNATLRHLEIKVTNQTAVIDSTTAKRADVMEAIEQLKPEGSKRPDLTWGEFVRARGFAQPVEKRSKKRPPADDHPPPG